MANDLDTIVDHYEAWREEARLTGGLAELELVRTQEILRRHRRLRPASSTWGAGRASMPAGCWPTATASIWWTSPLATSRWRSATSPPPD
ncbi:MAG: hypothetical protein ACRDZ7_17000 [Acidimicrobiia bacterium]